MPESAKPKQSESRPQQSEQQPADTEQQQGEQQESDDNWDPEKVQERGWFGERPEAFDDKEFALETGPNSPGERDLVEPDDYDSSKTVLDK
jgi:hypothetical protein